jgi:hypothetical protein
MMKKNVEKKIMGNLVVKANSLINASFKLDLIEQRLIILAITEARETGTGITSDSSLTVHASKYTETFGGERKQLIKPLKRLVIRFLQGSSPMKPKLKQVKNGIVADG